MLINLSKFFLAMMILYADFFQVFYPQDNLTKLLGFVGLFFLLIAIYKMSIPLSNGITTEIVLWAVFGITCLFIGFFIVADQGHLVNSVFMFFIYLIMISVICFLAKYEGNIDFIVRVKLLVALLCAVTTIFWGQSFRESGQLSMTANTNPNALGVLLVFGIFCLLYQLKIHQKTNVLFTSAGIMLLLYTIILTASRKSFLAALMLLIYWLIFVFRNTIQQTSLGKKIMAIATLILMIIFVTYLFAPLFENSLLLQRFFQISAGDERRVGMYKEAYQFFIRSPLFGVGFDNYKMLSVYGTYSHSTFAEVLACTGLLGAILYFAAYVVMAFKTIQIVVDEGIDHKIRMQARTILGILLVMITLSTGVVYLYDIDSSIAFGVIIAFIKVNYKTLIAGVPGSN